MVVGVKQNFFKRPFNGGFWTGSVIKQHRWRASANSGFITQFTHLETAEHFEFDRCREEMARQMKKKRRLSWFGFTSSVVARIGFSSLARARNPHTCNLIFSLWLENGRVYSKSSSDELLRRWWGLSSRNEPLEFLAKSDEFGIPTSGLAFGRRQAWRAACVGALACLHTLIGRPIACGRRFHLDLGGSRPSIGLCFGGKFFLGKGGKAKGKWKPFAFGSLCRRD